MSLRSAFCSSFNVYEVGPYKDQFDNIFPLKEAKAKMLIGCSQPSVDFQLLGQIFLFDTGLTAL